MNKPELTTEQKAIVDRVEFELSNIKDQDTLYESFKKLAKAIPNSYELGEVIRTMFPL